MNTIEIGTNLDRPMLLAGKRKDEKEFELRVWQKHHPHGVNRWNCIVLRLPSVRKLHKALGVAITEMVQSQKESSE